MSAAELLRALHRDGWVVARQRGSHLQLKHANRQGLVTVPRHTGAILGPKLLRAVLDQAGMTADDLRDLL
ncbi:MAG: type II toxin-antitoxin system HicA family toxin [Chloroflexi bacterium]|nr:type II toxin-antitoxin system HicA family toxin [Chloroflexota bacterium]